MGLKTNSHIPIFYDKSYEKIDVSDQEAITLDRYSS